MSGGPKPDRAPPDSGLPPAAKWVRSGPMSNATYLLVAILSVLPCAAATAGEPGHDHGSVGGPAHQPPGSEHAGHAHAHPQIGVAHPIITESPVPETAIKLLYAYADPGDGGAEHALAASLEYALATTFSLELTVPYAVFDPVDGGPFGRLDNVELAAKWATYRYADHGLIPAAGLAVGLPTGRDERGVGSDHVVGLEPFARLGYVRGPFDVVATVNLAIPLNQTADERDEEDFALAYNLAIFYRLRPDVQALVELHGESIFGDDASDAQAFYVSPGVTFQPFSDKSINLGVGVSLPLTDDRDFDYAVNLLAIFHL